MPNQLPLMGAASSSAHSAAKLSPREPLPLPAAQARALDAQRGPAARRHGTPAATDGMEAVIPKQDNSS